jgi:hypothetical protein
VAWPILLPLLRCGSGQRNIASEHRGQGIGISQIDRNSDQNTPCTGGKRRHFKE